MSNPRKPRTVKPLIAGTWNDDSTVFTASAKQPLEPIADVAEMVKWAKANLINPTDGGRVDFVRPSGRLNEVPRTTLKSEFVL
jgi:hypothetical protein